MGPVSYTDSNYKWPTEILSTPFKTMSKHESRHKIKAKIIIKHVLIAVAQSRSLPGAHG